MLHGTAQFGGVVEKRFDAVQEAVVGRDDVGAAGKLRQRPVVEADQVLGGERPEPKATQQPDLPRPYRVIGYPVVPALFIVAVAAFVVNSLVNDTTNSVITFVVILAGIPVYAVAFARNRA